jgi:RHS repeat-associated protein
MKHALRLSTLAATLACLLQSAYAIELPAPESGVVIEAQSRLPWEAERIVSTGLIEPLVAEISGREEKAVLQAVLKTWETRKNQLDRSALMEYLAAHPQSPWAASILGNLGLLALNEGRYTQAITDFEAAWAAGRNIEQPGVKAFVDHIGGELIRLRTRLGHKEAVAALLPELEKRSLAGAAASQFVTLAREGLWQMENPDGTTFMCGPLALEQLRGDGTTLDLSNAPPLKVGGYNLSELVELAHTQQQDVSAIYRARGTKVPVPSVVHWKSGHYAAVISAATHSDGRYYHVRDAALERDTWISEAALEDEASGYFLATMPEQTEPGWRLASVEESQAVIGAGTTSAPGGPGGGGSGDGCPGAPSGLGGNSNPNSCGCLGAGGGAPGPNPAAMIQHSTEAMIVSLALSDTPVVYHPPKGPQVPLTLAYNQREINQPATFTYSNVGPGWSFAGTPHIIDTPSAPTSNAKLYLATGGSHRQIGFNNATQSFAPDTVDQSVLVRVSTTPVIYERRLANGGKEIYSFDLPQGSTRRVFLTQVIDAAGNALTYHYDNASGSPRLQGFTDAAGGVTTLEYTHADPLKITAIVDPFGRKATITYDSLGRLASITDVIGIVSQVTYRNTGTFIERLDTPYGATLFNYGESGTTRWLEITDAQGKKERIEFRHNAPGFANSEPAAQVPTGVWPFNSYIHSRNTFYWDASALSQYSGNYTKAEVLHWHHDRINSTLTSGVLESIKHPLESRIWYNYPGQPAAHQSGTCDKPSSIARVLPDGSTQLTKMEYNAQGNVTRRIDPLGRETKYEYAANGIDLTRAQQKTATAWDTLSEITWNNQHRPLTVKDAAGRITKYTYNAAGQLTSQINALNQTTQYSYDAAGRLTQVKNPLGHTEATYTYDAVGNLATETDSEGYTLAYEYDALNRRTKTTYPDGTTTEWTWDKLDLATVKDRNGKLTQYQHDATRKLTSVTDALKTVSYGYADNGKLISLTDGNGQTTTWTRDLQGRIVAKVTPDGAQTTYAFDNAGRQTTRTDALGQVRTTSYAKDDRVIGISYANTVNPTANVNYVWDAYYPRITAMNDGLGTTGYSYKLAGSAGALKLAIEDGPFANDIVNWSYDLLGRIQSWYLGVGSETYTYDALGRITGTKNSLLGSFKYGYLGNSGQAISVQLTGSPLQRAYAYEPNTGDRRLAGINQIPAARSFGYTTLPENLITSQSETVSGQTRSWNYDYDAIDRLQSADRSDGLQYDYQLDLADNIQSIADADGTRTYAHDAANKIDQTPYQYDANGNLIADEFRTYQWDAENRLIGIGYTAEPQRSTEFRYDGAGRRLVALEKLDMTVTNETRYTWCGNSICQARDGNDQAIRYYFGEGSFRPTGPSAAAGEKRFYAKDHLGSIRDVLDSAGNNVASYDYGPYGELTNAPSNTPEFGYAGMQYHAPSGLYLTKYRAYDPQVERWLSRDPIGEAGGVNLYGYVGGNPVSWVDSLGLFTQVEVNAAVNVLRAEYPSHFPKAPTSVTPGIISGGALGYTDWLSDSITMSSEKFGDKSTCVKQYYEGQFLQTLAHEMLHVNESWWEHMLSSSFRMGNPLGFAHRNLDDLANELITEEIIKRYIIMRNADKDCTCKEK